MNDSTAGGCRRNGPCASGRWLCYRFRVERVTVGRPPIVEARKIRDLEHGHGMPCPYGLNTGPCRHDLRDSVDSK